MAYGFAYGNCAPVLGCLMGAPCIMVCVDAWRQFPVVLVVGALLGLGPSAVALLAMGRAVRTWDDRGVLQRASFRALAPLPFASLGILLQFVTFPFMAPRMVLWLLLLTLLIAAGMGVAFEATKARGPRVSSG